MTIYLWEKDKELIVERLRNPSVFKICAKVLDEPLLIENWIVHHSRIVGASNLIIADNMSQDSATLEVYERYSGEVTIFQFDGPHNQIHWHSRFEELFAVLKRTSRYFSFFDVDERLVQISEERWIADSRICELLEGVVQGDGIIPTAWIINKLNSFTEFSIGRPGETQVVLSNNLKWGKPILPAELIGLQAGIHNIQYESTKFAPERKSDLFLLHLTQFPERRILANRNKLVSRNIVAKGISPEEVLRIDFSSFPDKSFMPLVDEMRSMFQAISHPINKNDTDSLQLLDDGKVEFTSAVARRDFHEFLMKSPCLVKGMFSGSNATKDNFQDPAILLDTAIELRSAQLIERAGRLFRLGMDRFPQFPGKFGGPAFRKEYLRMLLAHQQWQKADDLVSTQQDSDLWGEHWHEILYARAFSQAGHYEQAYFWWSEVARRETDNAEAIEQLAKISHLMMDAREIKAARDSLLDDLKVVRESLSASRDKIHGFMKKFFQISGISAGEAYSAICASLEEMDGILADAGRSPREAGRAFIPKVVHRVWLTAKASPSEPPESYIEKLLNEAENYSQLGWVHRLWVQDPRLIPKTAARIEACKSPLLLTSIDSFLTEGKWRELFEAFVSARKFPFAADILRMKILQEFGGVYADLGARFRNERFARLISEEFDCALIFWDTMFFQNSLMAMQKNSAAAEIFIRLVEHPYSIPKQLLEPLNGITEGMAFSGLMITAILLALDIRSTRLCLLAPNAKAVEWASEKSWYTRQEGELGKFGNAYVPASGPSFFREELLSSSKVDSIFSPSLVI